LTLRQDIDLVQNCTNYPVLTSIKRIWREYVVL
jgi:hypothetical protein